MTFQISYIGALENADTVTLATTDMTEIVAGDNSPLTVVGYSIINRDSNMVTVSIYRRDGATDNLIWHEKMSGQSTTILEGPLVKLNTSDNKIFAQSSHTDSIDIYPILVRQIVNSV